MKCCLSLLLEDPVGVFTTTSCAHHNPPPVGACANTYTTYDDSSRHTHTHTHTQRHTTHNTVCDIHCQVLHNYDFHAVALSADCRHAHPTACGMLCSRTSSIQAVRGSLLTRPQPQRSIESVSLIPEVVSTGSVSQVVPLTTSARGSNSPCLPLNLVSVMTLVESRPLGLRLGAKM